MDHDIAYKLHKSKLWGSLTRKSHQLLPHPRPSETLLPIKVHPIPFFRPPILLPLSQRYRRLIWTQQRALKRIPPIYAQPRTRHLDPRIDISKQLQLRRKDLRQQQHDIRDTELTQPLLQPLNSIRIPLAAERPQYEADLACTSRGGDRIAPQRVQLLVGIRLTGEYPTVRVVAVRG